MRASITKLSLLRAGMPVMCAVLALTASLAGARQPAPFHLQEATIAGIHSAFAAGRLTCAQLTRAYLDRIAAYNSRGPALRAIITVNPRSMEIAAEMDRQYKANPSAAGSLHCVPIVLKDNFNTADMPTTGGNVGMKNSQPSADAFTVARIRRAGALILAKANMSEFARGGMSLSSLGGQVLNPYDLTRTPADPAAAPARLLRPTSPLSVLAAIRASRSARPRQRTIWSAYGRRVALVSRSGVIPNSQTQDEVGPIARTVTDAALLLDVMAGYDAGDPITAFGNGRIPKSYTHLLREDALKGARIGVMTNLFGDGDRHREVNRVMAGVIARMESLGATLVRFDLPEYDTLAPAVATATLEARTVMDRYFSTLGANPPVRSLAQLVAAKTSAVQKTLEEELAVVDGMSSQNYKDRMLNREKLRLAVATKIADRKLDAILYPLQKILAVPITADDQAERNGTLSNGTGFPAVTFQAGFSAPSASAPLGVPVGAELLGLDYTEDRLLAYAYAFEQAARLRKPPASTPALPHEP